MFDPADYAALAKELARDDDKTASLSVGCRLSPDGWESAIAKLARERAAELVKLAEELEG